ncbi:MAG: nucleotide exchange factor GrpE [Mycoplasma sp.]
MNDKKNKNVKPSKVKNSNENKKQTENLKNLNQDINVDFKNDNLNLNIQDVVDHNSNEIDSESFVEQVKNATKKLDLENEDNVEEIVTPESVEENKEQKVAPEIPTIQVCEKTTKIDELESKIKHLSFEMEKLNVKYSNLFDENLKLKKVLDEERNQLKQKLEQKAIQAQEIVDAKLLKIESDKSEDIKKAKNSFAEDLINEFLDPILLFESTITNGSNNPNPAVVSYLQGYIMIINMFNEKLDSLGVTQINVNVGDEFNENFMTAFDVEENPAFKPNKVVKVVKKGFVYNEKIIKYVSVVVSK